MIKKVIVWGLVMLAALVFVYGWKSLCEGAETDAKAAVIEPPDFSGPDWEFIGENDWWERKGTDSAYRAGHYRDYRHKTGGFLGREIDVMGQEIALKYFWLSGKKDGSVIAFLLTESYGWVRGRPGFYPGLREGREKGKIVQIALTIKADDGYEYLRIFDMPED